MGQHVGERLRSDGDPRTRRTPRYPGHFGQAARLQLTALDRSRGHRRVVPRLARAAGGPGIYRWWPAGGALAIVYGGASFPQHHPMPRIPLATCSVRDRTPMASRSVHERREPLRPGWLWEAPRWLKSAEGRVRPWSRMTTLSRRSRTKPAPRESSNAGGESGETGEQTGVSRRIGEMEGNPLSPSSTARPWPPLRREEWAKRHAHQQVTEAYVGRRPPRR